MTGENGTSPFVQDEGPDSPFDQLSRRLQERRDDAGAPSYSEIARRVGDLRGEDAHARPARSTVYDVFRSGRRRVDEVLLLDITRALGADESEVERWTERVRRARRGQDVDPPPAPPVAPEPEPEPEQEISPTAPDRRGLRPAMTELRLPPTRRAVITVVTACLVLNLLGSLTVKFLDFPLYLDMGGTALTAVMLGPWWGALVGLLTQVGESPPFFNGAAALPFIAVNVTGALLWGYGVRSWRMARSLPRFFAWNVLVALVCSMIATPILWFVFDRRTGNSADLIIADIEATGLWLFAAVFVGNLITSVVDKFIAGSVALVGSEAVLTRHGVPRDEVG